MVIIKKIKTTQRDARTTLKCVGNEIIPTFFLFHPPPQIHTKRRKRKKKEDKKNYLDSGVKDEKSRVAAKRKVIKEIMELEKKPPKGPGTNGRSRRYFFYIVFRGS